MGALFDLILLIERGKVKSKDKTIFLITIYNTYITKDNFFSFKQQEKGNIFFSESYIIKFLSENSRARLNCVVPTDPGR